MTDDEKDELLNELCRLKSRDLVKAAELETDALPQRTNFPQREVVG